MILRWLVAIFISFGCSEERCDKIYDQDEFKDESIVENGFSKVTLFKLNKNDTSIYSEHFFDKLGRTDSIVYLTEYGIEAKIFSFNSTYPSFPEIQHYYFDSLELQSENFRKMKMQSSYDSTRNIVIDQFYKDGVLDSYNVIKLDRHGNILRLDSYSQDSSLVFFSMNEYDSHGQKRRVIKYDPDSVFSGERVFDYTNSKAIPSSEKTYLNNKLTFEIERLIGKCYQVEIEREINHLENTHSITYYEYYDSGLPKSFEIKGIGLDDVKWIFEYKK